MSTMEGGLQQLLAFPPYPIPATPLPESEYDKQIKAHIHYLNTIPASKLTNGVPNGGGDLLDIVDPAVNTTSYLYILLAYISGSSSKQKLGAVSDSFALGSPLWHKSLEFMDRFDPIQVRYVGNEFRRLVEAIASRARIFSQPFAAVPAIRSAILRVDPSGATFTSTHHLFARLCLEARAYTDALPVLDEMIYYFPSAANKAAENNMFPYPGSKHESSSTYITQESGLSAKLDYRDHLLYFLFGAMLYMGLKEWKKALLFLEIVMTSPVTNNASKIQVEAYKKWVLVSLLYKGSLPSMPKTINSLAAKQYSIIGRPYEGLAAVFIAGIKEEEGVQRLVEEARAGAQFWSHDSNAGLVSQVIDAYRKFSILELEKTYSALTVAEIARCTYSDPNDYAETGRYVVHLISSRQLNATISEPSQDPETWIIRFSDSASGPLARSEEQQYEALLKQTRKIKTLTDHIKEIDRKLSLSKDLITDAKKRRKEKNEQGVNEGEHVWSRDVFDQDEDMMADI